MTSTTLDEVRNVITKHEDGQITIDKLTVTGKGFCTGGKHPSPPLHGHSLLCWMHAGHPKFGTGVFLEDQAASVEQMALALAETPDLTNLAAKFGTSVEHVAQAIDYAVQSGCLGAK